MNGLNTLKTYGDKYQFLLDRQSSMMMDILHRISQSDDPELFFWAPHLNKVQSMLNAGFIADTHDRASVVKNLIWLGLLTSRSVHTNIGRIQLLHVDSSTKILQRPVIDKIVRHEWLFHTPVDLELFVTIKWVDLPEDRPELLSDKVVCSTAFNIYRQLHPSGSVVCQSSFSSCGIGCR